MWQRMQPIVDGAITVTLDDTRAAMRLIAEKTRTIAEGAGGLALAARHANVLVTRTFSKIYGLAGERVGWATGAAPLIDALNRIRGPFNVTVSGQAGAVAALADQAFVEASRRHNRTVRSRFVAALEALGNHGIRAVPSEANFVLVLFEGALSAVLPHVGPDTRRELVVDRPHLVDRDAVRVHDRLREVDQPLCVRPLRRALQGAVHVKRTQAGEVPTIGRS